MKNLIFLVVAGLCFLGFQQQAFGQCGQVQVDIELTDITYNDDDGFGIFGAADLVIGDITIDDGTGPVSLGCLDEQSGNSLTGAAWGASPLASFSYNPPSVCNSPGAPFTAPPDDYTICIQGWEADDFNGCTYNTGFLGLDDSPFGGIDGTAPLCVTIPLGDPCYGALTGTQSGSQGVWDVTFQTNITYPNPAPIGDAQTMIAGGAIPMLSVITGFGGTYTWPDGSTGTTYMPADGDDANGTPFDICTPGTYEFPITATHECSGAISNSGFAILTVLAPCPAFDTVTASPTPICETTAVDLAATFQDTACGPYVGVEGTDYVLVWMMDGNIILDGRGVDGFPGTTDDIINLTNTTYTPTFTGTTCGTEERVFSAEVYCLASSPALDLGDVCASVPGTITGAGTGSPLLAVYGGNGNSTGDGYDNGCPGVAGSSLPTTTGPGMYDPCTGQFTGTGQLNYTLDLSLLPACAEVTVVEYQIIGTSGTGCDGSTFAASWACEANFAFYTPAATSGSTGANPAGSFSWSEAEALGYPCTGGNFEFADVITNLAGSSASGVWEILFFDDYDDTGDDGQIQYVYMRVDYALPPGCLPDTQVDANGGAVVTFYDVPDLGVDFDVPADAGTVCNTEVVDICGNVTITYDADGTGTYALTSSPANQDGDTVYYQVQSNGAPAGCVYQGTFTVNNCCNPDAGTVTGNVIEDCEQDPNGTVNNGVSVNAATGNNTAYTTEYILTDGTTITAINATGSFTNLAAGTYTIHSFNYNTTAGADGGLAAGSAFPGTGVNSTSPACYDISAGVAVEIYENPSIMMVDGTDALCAGSADGTATVTATGGDGTYTYAWSNGQTTATATGLAAGTYTVEVTDGNGCISDEGSVTIGEPTAATAAAAVSSDYNGEDISCAGAADGEATATAGGGTPAYTYLWSDGQTTAIATGLAAGTYDLTITDANGCTATSSVTLTEPTAVTASAVVDSDYNGEDVSCAGASDGEATATGGGGVGSYTYSWSNGQTTATATGLSAGTWSVVITDANGCTATTSVVLGEPVAVTATAEVTSAILCTGDANGEATVTAGGGVGGYTYLWDDLAAQTTATATGLAAGIYTVVVTDANGCTATTTISVVDPPALTCAALVQDVSCPGDADGVITVDINGGTPDPLFGDYEIFVDGVSLGFGGPGAVQITDFAAGTYDVLIVDANGCECGGLVTVEEPLPLSVSCESNGLEGFLGNALPFWYNTHQITVSGGTAPYGVDMEREGYVRWDISDNGDGTSEITINYADNAEWCVSIIDANGCTIDATTFDCCNDDGTGTGEPSIPGANGDILDIDGADITGESGVNNEDGSIELTIAGCEDAAGPTYEWSGPNGYTSTDASATGLGSGLYYVTVSCDGETTTGWYWVPLDRNGGRLKVGDSTPLGITAYPNPMIDNTTIEFTVENEGRASVQLFSIDGKFISELYNQETETGNVYFIDLKANELNAGTYITVIVDAQGERAMQRLVVMK